MSMKRSNVKKIFFSFLSSYFQLRKQKIIINLSQNNKLNRLIKFNFLNLINYAGLSLYNG